MNVTVRAAGHPEGRSESTPPAPRVGRPVLFGIIGLMTLGTLLFWVPLRNVDMDAMSGHGLISVLPVATLIGAAALVLAFMWTLALPRPRVLLLSLQILILLCSLHGVTLALEPIARFPTSWQTAGLIEYVMRNGDVSWTLDARFSTPGFFAFMAFLAKAVGQNDLEPLLRWAPPVINLLYLVPYVLILRVLRATWRAKWLAAFLFLAANWVGQDYLSPQAFAYLLYLFFVAILVNWFRHHDERLQRPGRRRSGETRERTGGFWRVYNWLFSVKDPGELPAPQVAVRQQSILLFLLFGLILVGTAAHQLTPFLMTASCAGLVVARRCSLRGLPFIAGIVYAGWISFMTVGYWVSRKKELIDSIGDLLGNLTQSTSGRISNSSPQIADIQQLRILITLVIVTLAVAGLLRRRARGIDDRVALVLMLVPFSSLGLQNYGGEIALRIYFFMLPAACLLVAYLFFPAPFDAPAVRDPKIRIRFGRLRTGPWRHVPAVAAASLFALALTGGFLTVRYGNEKFEQVRESDIRAFETMLDVHRGPIGVVWLTGEDAAATGGNPNTMPWGFRDWERFQYTPVLANRANPGDVTPIVTAMQQQAAGGAGAFFITTRSNEDAQVLNTSLARDYATRMRAALDAAASQPAPKIKKVFGDRDAAVYGLVQQPAPAPVPGPTGLGLRSSPWTPAGMVYLPVLLGVLLARELRRLRLPPNDLRRLRPLTVLATPLLLSVVAVIVERFIVIK